MATNFDFLEKENTLYELALFAEDLLVDGTTKLEYITAIDNMRKVLGLMMTRWIKKANITDADIREASKAEAEAKGKSYASKDINLFSRMIALEAYGCVSNEVGKMLHHIRTMANKTIHPEEDDGKIFDSSKEEVYKLAQILYAEFFECTYRYSEFQERNEPIDRQLLEGFKDNIRKKEEKKKKNKIYNANKNTNKENSKNQEKAKPESKPKPEAKAEPIPAPKPEVKPEQVVTPQPEVKSDPVITPKPDVKPEPIAASQPAPTPAPKVNNTPVGYDNPFKDYDVHESEEADKFVEKRGLLKVILWTPIVFFFTFFICTYILHAGGLLLCLIAALIYLIVGIVIMNRPRTKMKTWQIVISVIMAICSYLAVFRFGGFAWLILCVLFICSLICIAKEIS